MFGQFEDCSKLSALTAISKPPVVETAIGVQFVPLRLKIAHFGLFWKQIESDFPQVEERERLVALIEAKDSFQPETGWRVTEGIELPRVWYFGRKTAAGQQLLQLQSDRLIQNWRTASDGADYPSFDENKKRFDSSMNQFLLFSQRNKLGEFKAVQCELTYVNQIPFLGSDYRAAAAAAFTVFSNENIEVAGEQERFQFSATHWNNQLSGRVYIQIQPATRKSSGEHVMDFRLIARGAPASHDIKEVSSWLEEGHRTLMGVFTRMVRPEVIASWGVANDTK